MGRKLFVLLALTVLAASIPAESKTRGPSTPQERARALDYIQSLEQNPLAKDSLDKRMWLTEWIVQVPDFTVTSCCKDARLARQGERHLLEPVAHAGDLFAGGYILQHPEREERGREAGRRTGRNACAPIRRFSASIRPRSIQCSTTSASLEKQGKLLQVRGATTEQQMQVLRQLSFEES